MTEIENIREGWKHTIHGDGGKCPVCDRFGKVYARGINETMAKSLKWLYDENVKAGPREWIDVPNKAGKEVLRSNQLSTLRWWGLVERQTPDPTDKKHKGKHSGMWRITLKGMDFVDGKAMVPKKVYTYAGEPVGYSDDETDFASCKGKHFNIQDVMTETYKAGAKSLFPAGHKPAVVEIKPGIFEVALAQ